MTQYLIKLILKKNIKLILIMESCCLNYSSHIVEILSINDMVL